MHASRTTILFFSLFIFFLRGRRFPTRQPFITVIATTRLVLKISLNFKRQVFYIISYIWKRGRESNFKINMVVIHWWSIGCIPNSEETIRWMPHWSATFFWLGQWHASSTFYSECYKKKNVLQGRGLNQRMQCKNKACSSTSSDRCITAYNKGKHAIQIRSHRWY